MTSIKTIIFLLFSGCRAATINSRDYRPDEHLMLVDCGVGADGTAKSNAMAYYAGTYNPGGGDTKWVQPDMIANVPWDGSYPWRSSGVATTFSNGDTFQVAINPAIKDWEESKSYAGDAKHTFGNEFKCWAEHGKPAFDLPDGTACTSAYICFHQPDNPPPAPATAPATDFQVVTDYGMSKEEIQVRVQGTNSEVADWTPEAAFSHINEDDEGLQCKGTSYSIGNDCSIIFDDCFFSARENVPSMKKTLIEAVAPAVAKTNVTKTGRYSGSCRNEGMCEPDYEFEYLEYTYPVTGTVLVSVLPDGKRDKASTQARIHWTVSCPSAGICGSFCDDNLQSIISFATGLAGMPPVGEWACAACK
ncbi:Transposase [Fusarium oxysporum f. sp. albedinis]|nr:Transposase [Fusarium oxysporum f. sp. albedinis]KAK2482269.1 hypothetical protein H9L39_04061 [Fusarium oxysporum f. sp. albedinis]